MRALVLLPLLAACAFGAPDRDASAPPCGWGGVCPPPVAEPAPPPPIETAQTPEQRRDTRRARELEAQGYPPDVARDLARHERLRD